MAQLAASIVSHDEEFKRQVARLLRAGGVPVVIIEGREDAAPDVFVIDIRTDASSGMATIERTRAGHNAVSIFAIAAAADPSLFRSRRAGATSLRLGPGGRQILPRVRFLPRAVRKSRARGRDLRRQQSPA